MRHDGRRRVLYSTAMAESSSEFAGQVEIAPGRYLPAAALDWSFVRSGGPGGQNVNKVATKAVLSVRFDDLAGVLPGWALTRLIDLAGSKATDEALVLSASSSRSQLANRRGCLLKLRGLVVEALDRPKPRRKTRPSKAAVRRRIEEKKQRGQIKRRRKPPRTDEA